MNRPTPAPLLCVLVAAAGFTLACESSTDDPVTDAATDTTDVSGGDADTSPSAEVGTDTPAPADTEAPTVTGTVPTDGGCMETGVREIYFSLSESPLPSTLFAPSTILVSATSAADGMTRDLAVRVSLAPSDAPVPGGGTWYQIEPTEESEGFWSGAFRVEITTALTDVAGNALAAPFVWSFNSRC